MPRALLTELKTLASWEAECRSLQPKRDKFEWAFLGANTPEFQPGLTAEQLSVVKARIETAWASLFHPPPTNCAQTVVHGYLHDELRERALSFLGSLSVGQQDVHDLLSQQRSPVDQIDEPGRKISRVEGDRDGTMATLKSELKRVSDEVETLETQSCSTSITERASPAPRSPRTESAGPLR